MILCPPINSYILHNCICGSLNVTIKANCHFLLSLHVVELQLTGRNKLHRLLCLALQTSKIKQFLCSDWLAEWAGWAYLALLVLSLLHHMKKIFVRTVNKYFVD